MKTLMVAVLLIAGALACSTSFGEDYSPSDNPGQSELEVGQEGGCGLQAAHGIGSGPTRLLPLKLQGPDYVADQAQFIASGGFGRYSWTIDGCASAQIDQNGYATNLANCCGAGKVSVADQSNQEATLDIRFKNGHWTSDKCENVSPFSLCPNVTTWPPGPPCYCTKVDTSGSTRTTKYYSSRYGCIDKIDGTTSGDCSGEQITQDQRMSGYFTQCYSDSGYTGNCEGVYDWRTGRFLGWRRSRLYAIKYEKFVCN